MDYLLWSLLIIAIVVLLAAFAVFLAALTTFFVSKSLLSEWDLKIMAFEKIVTATASLLGEMRAKRYPSGTQPNDGGVKES